MAISFQTAPSAPQSRRVHGGSPRSRPCPSPRLRPPSPPPSPPAGSPPAARRAPPLWVGIELGSIGVGWVWVYTAARSVCPLLPAALSATSTTQPNRGVATSIPTAKGSTRYSTRGLVMRHSARMVDWNRWVGRGDGQTRAAHTNLVGGSHRRVESKTAHTHAHTPVPVPAARSPQEQAATAAAKRALAAMSICCSVGFRRREAVSGVGRSVDQAHEQQQQQQRRRRRQQQQQQQQQQERWQVHFEISDWGAPATRRASIKQTRGYHDGSIVGQSVNNNDNHRGRLIGGNCRRTRGQNTRNSLSAHPPA